MSASEKITASDWELNVMGWINKMDSHANFRCLDVINYKFVKIRVKTSVELDTVIEGLTASDKNLRLAPG